MLNYQKQKKETIKVYLSNKQRIFAVDSLTNRLSKREETNIENWDGLLSQIQKKYNTFYFDKSECFMLESALISASNAETKAMCLKIINIIRKSLNNHIENNDKR